jgi:hypothetical protein
MNTVLLAAQFEKHLNQKERKKLAAVNLRYDAFERQRIEVRIALEKERETALTPEQEVQYITHAMALRENQSET